MPLPQVDRQRIRRLKRGPVATTLSKLSPSIKSARWTTKSNRYSVHTINRIGTELRTPPRTISKPKDLAEYIAASCLLHCADGWSYLGKALHALLRGDPHKVRHLGYYAELRAAMSLLASEGIGVFDREHFIVDAHRNVTRLTRTIGTHRFVWECLDYWSGLKKSGELFATVVTPNQRSISDWFTPIGGTKVVSPQAHVWFRQWGMDLRMPRNDRDARNDSSYRPDGIPIAWSLAADTALRASSQLWEVFGVSGSSLFGVVDNHLLRIALERTFKGTTGSEPKTVPAQYAAFIDNVVNYQAFEAGIATNWKQFLTRVLDPQNPELLEYSRIKPTNAEYGHIAVIARAALLLRVAAGSAQILIREADISSDTLKFWWESLGTYRGLWEGPREKEDLLDLWEDVSPHLEEVRVFLETTPPDQRTFHRMGTELSRALMCFGGCERFAIWSMTP